MNDQPKRILLVEDEVFVAMSLAMELRNAGYKVVKTCASGENAVAYLGPNPVDLVLMDIGLAGEMDGVAAAGLIRTFSTVPIVFMTGYVDKKNDPAILEIQALGFLVKPVVFSHLQALLDAL